FSRNTLPDNDIDDPAGNIGEAEHKANQGPDADELSHQLSRVPVEQARNVAANPIPTAAVVRSAIRKQPDGDHAPQPIRSMNRDGADGIIHLDDSIEEFHAQANQHTRD